MTGTSRILALAMTLALALPGAGYAKERLRMSLALPPTHPLFTQVIEPWTQKVEEVTEGRVEVRILPKLVGTLPGQYDVAATGQADIALGNQSYNPGRFKQYAFVELPGGGDSAEATSVAFWQTYNAFFGANNEMSDVKTITLFTSGPGQLFTTGHVVESIDGNAGVKVRGGGEAATRVVDTLGMTSVQAPFSKAAEMISNGVVDGAMLDRSLVPAFGFDRYFTNRFVYDGGLYNVSYFIVMNLDSWNKLSPADQAAINAISGEVLARDLGRVWDQLGAGADAGFEASGVVTTVAEGQLKAALDAAFSEYEQDWIDQIADTGTDGRAVIDSFRAAVSASGS